MPSARALRPLLLAFLALIPAIAIGILAPERAQAANFTVDSPVDAVDASPGDGACASAAGDCTLRAAIQETNALPGADVITLPVGTYVLSIVPGGVNGADVGDLNITDDVTITGGGLRQLPTTIVDGNLLDRAFDIDDPVSVTMALFTITNGAARDGGAIKITQGALLLDQMRLTANTATGTGNPTGGAIAAFSDAGVTITDSILSGNSAESSGGAIWNDGTLLLQGSVLTTNTAGLDGGGLRNGGVAILETSSITGNTANGAAVGGGGIYNTSGGSLTLVESGISLNSATAAEGGGLRNSGIATLTDSTIALNTTPAGNGAGIHNIGLLTVSGSTISANAASGDGGGLLVASGGEATASLTNSTLSGNTAGDDGGGIQAVSGATVTLTHATIALNTAAGSGGGINAPSNTVVTVQGSILDANTGANCSGAVVSVDYNLDRDGSCGFGLPNDLNTVDPLLEPLDLNGGPTQTHALPAGSPAVNTANPASHPLRDQRGVLRPAATPDIGAFERSIIDLDITIEAVPPGLLVPGVFPLEFIVSNDGPDDAQRVRITANVPPGVDFSRAGSGCTVSQVQLTCDLADLATGAGPQTVVLSVGFTEPGAFNVVFTISGANSEATPDDNTIALQLTEQEPPTRTTTLVSGWNLVPWSGPPTPVADAFASIRASLQAAFAWDAPAQRFDGFLPSLPPALNALDTLTPGMALWILIGGAADVDWEQPAGALPDRVTLVAGFNLVVWGGGDGVPIATGLGQILGLAGSVSAWDAAAQAFLGFSPNLPAQLNALQEFQRGLSFWIEVSGPATWIQQGQ